MNKESLYLFGFSIFVGGEGIKAVFQLEVETCLFSLQQAKMLRSGEMALFMQLTTCKERLALLGVCFVPCWHL